jgi:NADH:ubiquinone oxidoreductase subunit D
MDLEKSLEDANFWLTKSLLRLKNLMRDIPENQKEEIKKDLEEIFKELKEAEVFLEKNQDGFTKKQFLKIGKTHGRIETLLALLSLKVKE